jgi:hypothetical protein
LVVPGIGAIQGFCASNQASAICAGVACVRSANVLSHATNARFAFRFSSGALGDVASVLDHIAERRERPAGRVRLVVSPLAAAMVLAPTLAAFARAYPDVVLDVTTTNEVRLDVVAGHFDAGIHLVAPTARTMSGCSRCCVVPASLRHGASMHEPRGSQIRRAIYSRKATIGSTAAARRAGR